MPGECCMRSFVNAVVVLFALVGLLASLVVGGGVYVVSHLVDDDEPLPKQMVLTLTVAGPFAEEPDPPLGIPFLDQGPQPVPLVHVTRALAAAATDPAVAGVFVRLEDAALGMAQAQELRNAITTFRLSGKPAQVFAETMGEFGDGTVPYYIASAFDRVWIQPSGLVGITGFGLETPYLRGLLDDLGILPQFATRKAYKTAPEPLTDYAMSQAAFESNRAVVDGWAGQVVRAIAAARGRTEAEVRALIDQAPLLAREALEGGLVDALAYADQVEAAMTQAAGTETRVPIATYAAHLQDRSSPAGARRMILIAAAGPVVVGDGERGPFERGEIDARVLAAAIDEAVADPEAAAIVLRIDSPGGSYVGSDLVYRAIVRARERGMPVVASLGDAAASGGYFIAMGANRIVAQPGTLTGSIGVFAGKMVIGPASERLGIAWDSVAVGRNATMFSAARPFDAAGRARLDAILDAIYDDFTTKAAEARGLAHQALEAVAQGRVWTGEDALTHGLVDDLGGLSEAFAVAREEAGLDPATPLEIVTLPRPDGPEWLVTLLTDLEGVRRLGASLAVLEQATGLIAPLLGEVIPLVEDRGRLAPPTLPHP